MSRLVAGLFCILLLQGGAGIETGTASRPATHIITMYPGAWLERQKGLRGVQEAPSGGPQ